MNGRKNAKQYKNNAVTLTILKYSATLKTVVLFRCRRSIATGSTALTPYWQVYYTLRERKKLAKSLKVVQGHSKLHR